METMKIDLESLRQPHWSPAENENVERITAFVQLLMNDHDFDAVLSKFDNSAYTQHNRNIPDGMSGIVGFLKHFVKRFPEYTYDVKRIHADGDHVIFHSHATIKKGHRGDDTKGMSIIDNWRVEDGQIVEHWDAIQALDGSMRLYALLKGGKIANSNGVF
ncbi:MAG: nuclear transport factor 2 family protein [Verrucomicrobiota bacterium]